MLSNIGVDIKVELPGVGENVQGNYTSILLPKLHSLYCIEHIVFGMSFELNPDDKHETFDLMRDTKYAETALALQYIVIFQSPHMNYLI